MPLVGQTNVRADLRQRVADVRDLVESSTHAVTDRWMRAMNAVMSLGRNPDERAKSALSGWFAAMEGTGKTPDGIVDGSPTVGAMDPAASKPWVKTGRRSRKPKQGHGMNKRTPKEELGTSTWVFLHTLAAQYPENPSTRQKRDVKNLIDIMTRLYPCGECAEHFQEIVKVHPPQVESRETLSRWMCDVHNVVNRSLNKPVFNCAVVSGRWPGLDEDGCGNGRGCHLRKY